MTHSVPTPESLEPAEQAVIALAAENHGVMEIANRPETCGPAVRAGRTKLFDPRDWSYAARCCAAVPRLVDLQLIREKNASKRYELTNFGWELSRRLCSKTRYAIR